MNMQKTLKERLKNHLQYAWWQYLALALAAGFGWSLIFTTTAYRAPAEKRLDVYFVTYSVPEETLEWFQEQILGMFDDVEDSDCLSIVYTDDDNYYGSMQMSTYMAAGQGDVYIMARERFETMKSSEGFLPLDEAIAQGKIDLHGIDVTPGMALDAQGAPYVAGIPAASLNKLKELDIANDDLYICVMVNSANTERDCAFVDWLIDTMYQPAENAETETKSDKNGAKVSDMPSY